MERCLKKRFGDAREVVVARDVERRQKRRFRLAFGRKESGSGSHVAKNKNTSGRWWWETNAKNRSGSRLDSREVVVGGMLKEGKKKTSSSRLNAREVVVARDVSRRLKNRFRLAFGCEGSKEKKNTSGSRLNAREVVVARDMSRRLKKTGSDSHLDAREVVVGGMLEEESKTPPARV